MILQECYTLPNGVTVPKLGLGTWFIEDDKAAQAVRDAVAAVYPTSCRMIWKTFWRIAASNLW